MATSLDRIADALERIAATFEHNTATAAPALAPEGLCKEDAARFLGVDVAAVEHLIRTRKLAYVQYGSQRGRIIAVEDLRQFLKDNRQPTSDELVKKRKRV